jgi:hypothetical protein
MATGSLWTLGTLQGPRGATQGGQCFSHAEPRRGATRGRPGKLWGNAIWQPWQDFEDGGFLGVIETTSTRLFFFLTPNPVPFVFLPHFTHVQEKASAVRA